MFKKIASLMLIAIFPLQLWAQSTESEILISEYERLLNFVENVQPDGMVGGIMYFKKMADYEILWDLAKDHDDYSVIRIFRNYDDGDDFAVSYFHNATHIVDGKKVLRRFVGPNITGWRNDTIDLDTNEYLGNQGMAEPLIKEQDLELLEIWGIELF